MARSGFNSGHGIFFASGQREPTLKQSDRHGTSYPVSEKSVRKRGFQTNKEHRAREEAFAEIKEQQKKADAQSKSKKDNEDKSDQTFTRADLIKAKGKAHDLISVLNSGQISEKLVQPLIKVGNRWTLDEVEQRISTRSPQ